jgi:hypothetical protein
MGAWWTFEIEYVLAGDADELDPADFAAMIARLKDRVGDDGDVFGGSGRIAGHGRIEADSEAQAMSKSGDIFQDELQRTGHGSAFRTQSLIVLPAPTSTP